MADEPAALLGTKLGAYEILGFIATGGMGTVYRAKNRVTGELRALKVMRSDIAARPEFVARFFREAKLAASTEHPYLVRVFEPGMEGDTVFLPMELLEGETLAERIAREKKMEEGEVITIVQKVGAAVVALHDKGILHRDLKPSNVFLSKEKEGVVPKVIDLGAAKEVEASGESTATGLTIGSPHYMSVEQASGAKDIDARTDQFSLGVVLYQMLTGVRPYENDDSGHALAKLLAGAEFVKPRVLVPQISMATEAAILRALSRDRDRRFPTLAEFLSALPKSAPPSADDGATRFAPIEERVATKAPAKWASGSIAVPIARTRLPIILAAIAICGLAFFLWMRPHAIAEPAKPVATISERGAPPQILPTAEATATPLGLQGVQAAEITSEVTASAATASTAPPRGAAKESASAHPKSHPASPKGVASVAPCTPTPGAPCL